MNIISAFTILISIGCKPLTLPPQYVPALYIEETIDGIDIQFSTGGDVVEICNDDVRLQIYGGNEKELLTWLKYIDNGGEIICISCIYTDRSNSVSCIRARDFEFYYGEDGYTWIISRRMLNEGIEYLSQ